MIFLRDPETALLILNATPIGFFTRPHINVRSMKAQKVTQGGMRQRMFILGPSGPLHNSGSSGLTVRVH